MEQAKSNLSAIELLHLGDEGRTKTILNQYWPTIVGVSLGVGVAVFINYQTKRPPLSGIQKHVAFAASLTGVLTYITKKRDDYFAEKDAVYSHYVSLHPEDFPTPERKKISDLFEPWIPIR